MREWIHGRNAVAEVLLNPLRQAYQLQLAQGIQNTGRLPDIRRLAQQKNLTVTYIHRKNLDQRFGEKHQGVALEASGYPYASVDEIITEAQQRSEPLFVLLLDVLKNPQNMGTLLRTAEAVGVHGEVIPTARTAEVNRTVVNASSGAQPIAQVHLDSSLGLLVGSEGQGMRSLTRKACDYLIALPMKGRIESLNAAVAGSVALYMALQAREAHP